MAPPVVGQTGPGAGTDEGAGPDEGAGTPDRAEDTAGGVARHPPAAEGEARQDEDAPEQRRREDETVVPGDAALFRPPLQPDIYPELVG